MLVFTISFNHLKFNAIKFYEKFGMHLAFRNSQQILTTKIIAIKKIHPPSLIPSQGGGSDLPPPNPFIPGRNWN